MKYSIGMKASISKTITEADIILFSGISMDINSVHLSEEYAKNTIFNKRIAHGILVASLISAVLGTKAIRRRQYLFRTNIRVFKASLYRRYNKC